MYRQVLEKYEEINKKRERMVTMVNLMACEKTKNNKQFDKIKTLTSVSETIVIN
jgi:endonuclease IV